MVITIRIKCLDFYRMIRSYVYIASNLTKALAGMECIPQNKDCALQILKKVDAVANVALNLATAGVFCQLQNMHKSVQVPDKR